MTGHIEGANITDSTYLICPTFSKEKSWKAAERSMEDMKRGQKLACLQYIKKKKRWKDVKTNYTLRQK